MWDNLELTPDTELVLLVHFYISPEELKCKNF